MEEPCNGMPSSLWAYNATAKGKPLLGGGLVLALSVLAGCVALLEVMVTGTSISKDMVGVAMPLIMAGKEVIINGAGWVERTPVRRRQPKTSKITFEEHCRRGHCPHDPDCDICKRARMRAPPARKRKEGQVVVGAALGYVMSMDYAGPFEPDVDGNKYFLAGVEVAHTKLGFVELTKDRTAPEAVLSAKKMIRDLHIAGPNPEPLVRIHTDDATSF